MSSYDSFLLLPNLKIVINVFITMLRRIHVLEKIGNLHASLHSYKTRAMKVRRQCYAEGRSMAYRGWKRSNLITLGRPSAILVQGPVGHK